MAKRLATSVLTHDNWDQEEEPEEAGTFKIARAEELKNRVIKKARRKGITEKNENGASPFAGFTGLSKPTDSFSKTPNFDFLKTYQAPKSLDIITTGMRDNKNLTGVTTSSNKMSVSDNEGSSKIGSGSNETGMNEEYLKQLKLLNENFFSWTKQHLDKHPHYILTPIFQDYEKHLKNIEMKFESSIDPSNTKNGEVKEAVPQNLSANPNEADPSKSAGGSSLSTQLAFFANKDGVESSTFSFGGGKNASETGSTNKFDSSFFKSSVEMSTTSGNLSTGFFGSSKPDASNSSKFPSFLNQKFNAATTATLADTKVTDVEAENDPDEVPKVEVEIVEESDNFFSQRCKMFYKKDQNFVERGVGNLYLKKLPEGKVQLLFRAETNLGNILLNILLQKSIPVHKMGKNNVLIVCFPNPPIEKESKDPAKILFKVRQEQDADRLCDMLLNNRC